MARLWLNYTDKEGYSERIPVDRTPFTIGRNAENDLCFADNRLSRQHLKIERIGDKFVVTDCDSSNGTQLNFDELFEPETLRDGDALNLGGGLEIRVEIIEELENSAPLAQENVPKPEAKKPQSNQQNTPVAYGGISASFFFIAPALGFLILLIIGGLYYFVGGEESEDSPKDEIAVSNTRELTRTTKENLRTSTAEQTPTPTKSVDNSVSTPIPENNSSQPNQKPIVSGENKQIDEKAREFMKRIARNDDNPFLRAEEIEAVKQRIKKFKNSNDLAENFRAVLREKSQYQTLADSQALKPQSLAAAALNEIGNRSGNPLETAKTMLPILGKLKISLDNNFADDNFLIIASYEQGKKGNINAMQNKLAGFAKTLSENNESVSNREMRKVWFLKKRGKLTDAEFEYTVNFIAIGVIMQSPKDFGINSEAVVF